MDFSVKAIPLSLMDETSTSQVVSISVDCDALVHYLPMFAPKNTKVGNDLFTYSVFCKLLLEIFRKLHIKATFFCIAEQLRQPHVLEVFQRIVADGHQIGNHTLSHPDISIVSEKEHLSNISEGHHLIHELLHIEPVGYRAPAYFMTAKGLFELTRLGYSYDASVYYSPLSRILFRCLSMVKKDIKVKPQGPLHKRFRGNGPYLISFNNGNKLLEWPIPHALGLIYNGTFHSSAPTSLFLLQTKVLKLFQNHIHYQLHPMEIITQECVQTHPWLKNLPFAHRTDLAFWLEKRLKQLISNHTLTTLENLSASNLHLLQ